MRDDSEERADLASRVKQLQRESEDGKQQWWAWCDAEGFSNRRDPQRHTAEFLKRFFEARRDGRIPAGRPLAAPAHEVDPEMHKVWVNRIKQAQRSSPDQKLRWERYCDAYGGCVRDPQRHDSSFLRRFFDEFNTEEAAGGPMPGYPPMAGYPGMSGYPMPGYPTMPMGYPPMGGMPPGMPGGEGGAGVGGFPQMPGYPPMMPGMPDGFAPWMVPGADGQLSLENGGDRDRSRGGKDKKKKKKGKDKDKDRKKKRKKAASTSSSSSSRSRSRSKSKAKVRRKKKKRAKISSSSSAVSM